MTVENPFVPSVPDSDPGLPTPNSSGRSTASKPTMFPPSDHDAKVERALATVKVHLAKTSDSHLSGKPPILGPFQYELHNLSRITKRICQTVLVDLAATITSMEAVDAQQIAPTAADLVTTDLINGSVLRKNLFLEFGNRNKDKLVQLLVLYDWARSYSKGNKKLLDVVTWERQIEANIFQAIHAVGQAKVDIEPFQIPPPDLMTALTILGSGQPQRLRWPDFGFTKRTPASPALAYDMLIQLNTILHIRMTSHIGFSPDRLPPPMSKWRIRNGRVTFIVDGEFELDLSIATEDPDPVKSQWWFVDFRWAFSPSKPLPDLCQERDALELAINEQLAISFAQLVEASKRVTEDESASVLPADDEFSAHLASEIAVFSQTSSLVGSNNLSPHDETLKRITDYAAVVPSYAPISTDSSIPPPPIDISCLQLTYNHLHNLTLTHKVNLLRHQALHLAKNSGRWVGTLYVESAHRMLIVQYWSGVPGPRSWLEVGLKSGKVPVRHRDLKSGKLNAHKTLGRDWRGPLPPRIGVRWIQSGETMDLEMIPGVKELKERVTQRSLQGVGNDWDWETEAVGLGDLTDLNIEASLQRMVCVHAIRMFERIAHRIIVPARLQGVILAPSVVSQPTATALRVTMSVQEEERNGLARDQSKHGTKMFYPQIVVRLGNNQACPATILAIEPLSGKLGLLPINSRSIQASEELNALTGKQRMAGTEVARIVKKHAALCFSDVIQDSAKSLEGWKVETGWRIHQEKFGRLTAEYRAPPPRPGSTHAGSNSVIDSRSQLHPPPSRPGQSFEGSQLHRTATISAAHARVTRPPDTVACHFIRPNSWVGAPWILMCTLSFEEAERWWIVEVDRLFAQNMVAPSVTVPKQMVGTRYDPFASFPVFKRPTSRVEPVVVATTVVPRSIIPLYPSIPSALSKIKSLSAEWFSYLESVAVGAIGSRITQSQLSAMNVSHHAFPGHTRQAPPAPANRSLFSREPVFAAADDKVVVTGAGLVTVVGKLRNSIPFVSASLADLLSVGHRKRKRGPNEDDERRNKAQSRSISVSVAPPRGPTPTLEVRELPLSRLDSDMFEKGDHWAADIVRITLLGFLSAGKEGSKDLFGFGNLSLMDNTKTAAQSAMTTRPSSLPVVCYAIRGLLQCQSAAVKRLGNRPATDSAAIRESFSSQIQISSSGSFCIYIPVSFGKSCVRDIVHALRLLARLVIVVSELEAAGLGSRITAWNLKSVQFEYEDPVSRKLAPPGFQPAKFSATIGFPDPSGPCTLSIPPNNPHRHWNAALLEVLTAPGFSTTSEIRIGVRNFLFAIAHSAAVARSLASLQDLDALLTSIVKPHTHPPSATEAVEIIDRLAKSRLYPPSIIRELARSRKRVVMQHQIASASASSAGIKHPVQAAVLLSTPILTLQPTGVLILPQTFKSIRIKYRQPKLLFELRMVIIRGTAQWQFEFIHPQLRQPAPALSPTASSAEHDDHALITSLRNMLSVRSQSWIGYTYGAIARIEGVDEVIWRLDQVVRAIRAAAVSRVIRSQFQNSAHAHPLNTLQHQQPHPQTQHLQAPGAASAAPSPAAPATSTAQVPSTLAHDGLGVPGAGKLGLGVNGVNGIAGPSSGSGEIQPMGMNGTMASNSAVANLLRRG